MARAGRARSTGKVVARMGRPLAACVVRRSHSTKLTPHSVATLLAGQRLRISTKQRLDYTRLAGGGAENPCRRQDRRRIVDSAGGAAVRGGIGRGNRRWRLGFRAQQPLLCAAFEDPGRKAGRGTANRSGRTGASELGGVGA